MVYARHLKCRKSLETCVGSSPTPGTDTKHARLRGAIFVCAGEQIIQLVCVLKSKTDI